MVKAKRVDERSPTKVPRTVGEVVMRALGDVKPNSWNPNELTPFMMESLAEGFRQDGWLKSQALLVWGNDEKKHKRNIIIDGEHRWEIATKLGMKDGPMVFLNGLTEVQAKALTVKLDAKRGTFVEERLALVLRDVQHSFPEMDLRLTFGIEDEERLMKLLAEEPKLILGEEPPVKNDTTPGDVPSGMTSHVRMMQLFFSESQQEEFLSAIKKLAPTFKTENVTDTTLEAIRRAVRATKS